MLLKTTQPVVPHEAHSMFDLHHLVIYGSLILSVVLIAAIVKKLCSMRSSVDILGSRVQECYNDIENLEKSIEEIKEVQERQCFSGKIET